MFENKLINTLLPSGEKNIRLNLSLVDSSVGFPVETDMLTN